jgi:hypothetical protein
MGTANEIRGYNLDNGRWGGQRDEGAGGRLGGSLALQVGRWQGERVAPPEAGKRPRLQGDGDRTQAKGCGYRGLG